MPALLEMCRPGDYSPSVLDIDLAALKDQGLECLMLDLDNTLLPWQSSVVPEPVRQWVERAKDLGMRLAIVSNTHNPKRLSAIASELGVASIARALKPRRRGFLVAASMIGCRASNTAVVGDQILTDILGGNLAGMRTILVRPMHRREFVGTKVSRLLEMLILAALGRRAKSGTKCG